MADYDPAGDEEGEEALDGDMNGSRGASLDLDAEPMAPMRLFASENSIGHGAVPSFSML